MRDGRMFGSVGQSVSQSVISGRQLLVSQSVNKAGNYGSHVELQAISQIERQSVSQSVSQAVYPWSLTYD